MTKTQLPQVSNAYSDLKQAIARQNHSHSLHILQQLPLKNRWSTLFLLQRAFSKNPAQRYIQALLHDLLYRAYREELTGNLDEAKRLYRLLIPHHRQVSLKARAGYDRIVKGVTHKLPTPSIPTESNIADHETSLILLETVLASQKQSFALKLAHVLNTDPYTARMTIPSIEFRMLRYGQGADLARLHQALVDVDIPNRRIPLSSIHAIPVHDVRYIESVGDQLVVQVRDRQDPKASVQLSVAWSDIQQRVDGLLPLFEEVFDRTQKGKVDRKTETQDHAQIFDLHLGDRQGILRFYDASYQFNQGVSLVTSDPQSQVMLDTRTSWAQWQGLKQLLATHLPPIPEHLKFDHFASTAIEHIELLAELDSQIHLFRRYESYWDQVFHLYSALHYLNLV